MRRAGFSCSRTKRPQACFVLTTASLTALAESDFLLLGWPNYGDPAWQKKRGNIVILDQIGRYTPFNNPSRRFSYCLRVVTTRFVPGVAIAQNRGVPESGHSDYSALFIDKL